MKSLFVLMLVILSVASMTTNADSHLENTTDIAESDVIHIGAGLLKKFDAEMLELKELFKDKKFEMLTSENSIKGSTFIGAQLRIEKEIKSIQNEINELDLESLNTETEEIILEKIEHVKISIEIETY